MKIKFEKSSLGTLIMVVGDKVEFYLGRKSGVGLGVDYQWHDRSLTFELLFWYFGVTVYHKDWNSEE